MKNKLEMNILKALLVISLGLFINLIRKPPIKDWLLVFLIKSYFATFIDNLLVRKGFLKYPVNIISGFFKITKPLLLCLFFFLGTNMFFLINHT
ncbi:hypothetical protein M3175_09155 [Robertmurraya korlensis]|uniref:hypothetical protein n=1 Tax=Robertmurraya korlensis TaxID=519977 RepID=UPI002041FAB8|nr:hypothetical protein [Robertmurraya korlensis]MCM3600898.1 hypothetical protein [Robertmurraya korlensis]